MFADRLTYLRKKKKRTQQEMADAIGISRPAYTAYENGNRKPDYDILNKIVDLLETNSDYLLGRSNDSSPPVTYNKELATSDNEIFVAYLGGPPKELDEEEAAHLEQELEMFRAFRREKQRRELEKKEGK